LLDQQLATQASLKTLEQQPLPTPSANRSISVPEIDRPQTEEIKLLQERQHQLEEEIQALKQQAPPTSPTPAGSR
jgi:hypothetical protein